MDVPANGPVAAARTNAQAKTAPMTTSSVLGDDGGPLRNDLDLQNTTGD
jgi:hypothetical protein